VFPLRDNVPTRTRPVATLGLIAANAVVWLWQVTGTTVNEDVAHYAYYPCEVTNVCVPELVAIRHPEWYAGAFSSMFMHGSWLHIAGNMLFLWIFGNNVEDAMGRVRYLAFYIGGGLAATALQTWVTLQFATAAEASIPNVGASGAVAAVLGAYFLLLPTARVLTIVFFVLLEVPAVLFLGAWFVFQLWEGSFQLTHPEAGGGVAFFAHIGGFVFGLLAVHAFAVRQPLRPRW
jgi:membrane associated rhomboid family serine protease